MLVELLPVEAWLLVLAAYAGLPVDQAAVPFWALLAAMAFAWVLAYRTRGTGPKAMMSREAIPFLLTYVVLLRVSAAAYGGVGGVLDFSWLGALMSDFATSAPRVSALFGLLFLLAAIWWRGTAMGADFEAASGNLRRFTLCMVALLLALVGAVAARPATQDALTAALTLILLAEVFIALLDAALARLEDVWRDGRANASNAPWIRTALGLAAAVIGFALLVSVVFNFNSFLALLAYLGPVGNAISFVLTWIAYGFAALLGVLLTPIIAPFQGKAQMPHLAPVRPAQQVCHTVKGIVVCPQATQSNGLLDLLGHLLIILAALVIIAVVVWIARATLNRRHIPAQSADDEREALDARGLLADQLRRLLSRRTPRSSEADEALPRGSIRYLYREVLRAAAADGMDRHSDETPDEFADRLGKSAQLAMASQSDEADVLSLSDAYDDARYGDREPEQPHLRQLQTSAEHLVRIFRGRGRGRG